MGRYLSGRAGGGVTGGRRGSHQERRAHSLSLTAELGGRIFAALSIFVYITTYKSWKYSEFGIGG